MRNYSKRPRCKSSIKNQVTQWLTRCKKPVAIRRTMCRTENPPAAVPQQQQQLERHLNRWAEKSENKFRTWPQRKIDDLGQTKRKLFELFVIVIFFPRFPGNFRNFRRFKRNCQWPHPFAHPPFYEPFPFWP